MLFSRPALMGSVDMLGDPTLFFYYSFGLHTESLGLQAGRRVAGSHTSVVGSWRARTRTLRAVRLAGDRRPTQTRHTPGPARLPDCVDRRVAEADQRQGLRQPQILSHFLRISCTSDVWSSPGSFSGPPREAWYPLDQWESPPPPPPALCTTCSARLAELQGGWSSSAGRGNGQR